MKEPLFTIIARIRLIAFLDEEEFKLNEKGLFCATVDKDPVSDLMMITLFKHKGKKLGEALYTPVAGEKETAERIALGR